MKIGILGTGNIGATLVKDLAAAGHDVRVANSRGPETIPAELLSTGAQAVTKEEALSNVEAVILSIPLNRIPDIAPLVATLPNDTVVIDTSNYFPFRVPYPLALHPDRSSSSWRAYRFLRLRLTFVSISSRKAVDHEASRTSALDEQRAGQSGKNEVETVSKKI